MKQDVSPEVQVVQVSQENLHYPSTARDSYNSFTVTDAQIYSIPKL